MIRIALVIAVTVGMARLAFAYGYFEDEPGNSLSLQDVQMASRRIDADWQRLVEFRKVLDECLIELTDNELTLPQACARVEEAARSYYPIYLKMLAFPTRSACTRERVAYNLIRHFTVELEDAKGDTTDLHKTMGRLRIELAKMFPTAAMASRD